MSSSYSSAASSENALIVATVTFRAGAHKPLNRRESHFISHGGHTIVLIVSRVSTSYQKPNFGTFRGVFFLKKIGDFFPQNSK